MTNKNTILLSTDDYPPIENFSIDQKGRLFDAIFLYAIFGAEEVEEDIKIAFLFFKQRIDKHNESPNSGRFHWNWKGGITPENARERKGERYSQWRKSVFSRDNFKCQCCGDERGRLNAHHIKPFALYPELRFDINNGITLCEKCHREIHKKSKRN